MKFFFKTTTALCAVTLMTGCTGIFESKTCGIRNSVWERMSNAEQFDIEKSYHEKQRLADQAQVNKLLLKQQKNLAKARKKNENEQEKRLKQERDNIQQQQDQVENTLKLKEQAYTPPEPLS